LLAGPSGCIRQRGSRRCGCPTITTKTVNAERERLLVGRSGVFPSNTMQPHQRKHQHDFGNTAHGVQPNVQKVNQVFSTASKKEENNRKKRKKKKKS
jgi:hypothetical protein